MIIYKNVVFSANHVVRFRGEVTEPELKNIMENLDSYIEENGARKTGVLITATHVLYLEKRVSDIEVFIPINKAIPITEDFAFLPVFSLVNCVMTKYKGHPYLIPNAYAAFYNKAKSLRLKLRPPFYNIYEKETGVFWGLAQGTNQIETDIYAVVEENK